MITAERIPQHLSHVAIETNHSYRYRERLALHSLIASNA